MREDTQAKGQRPGEMGASQSCHRGGFEMETRGTVLRPWVREF